MDVILDIRNLHTYCIIYIYTLWASLGFEIKPLFSAYSLFLCSFSSVKKNQISNILISLTSHYVYMFLKSQTFALFIYSRPYPITIIPSLFPFFSLHFSPFLPHSCSKPKCALLVQSSLYCQHISHGSDVALHSILYRICHAETLQDINIYSSAPHHCCLKLHLFHTLSYSSQILSYLTPALFFVCFYFSELIFYIFSGYLSLPPIWVELPRENRTQKALLSD